MSVFHQLQYFTHVCMLCATCKSAPQVLTLKPWTRAGKKKEIFRCSLTELAKSLGLFQSWDWGLHPSSGTCCAFECHLWSNTPHPPLAGSSACVICSSLQWKSWIPEVHLLFFFFCVIQWDFSAPKSKKLTTYFGLYRDKTKIFGFITKILFPVCRLIFISLNRYFMYCLLFLIFPTYSVVPREIWSDPWLLLLWSYK